MYSVPFCVRKLFPRQPTFLLKSVTVFLSVVVLVVGHSDTIPSVVTEEEEDADFSTAVAAAAVWTKLPESWITIKIKGQQKKKQQQQLLL